MSRRDRQTNPKPKGSRIGSAVLARLGEVLWWCGAAVAAGRWAGVTNERDAQNYYSSSPKAQALWPDNGAILWCFKCLVPEIWCSCHFHPKHGADRRRIINWLSLPFPAQHNIVYGDYVRLGIFPAANDV